MLVLSYDRGDTQRWARTPTQTAYSLHLAKGAVKRHLANAYEKMSVHSRGEATRMALFGEWITIQQATDALAGPEGGR